MYNPETYFTSVETKSKQSRKTAKVREVMLNLDQGAVIPTTVQNKICNTLIDTGATRSCISEEFYKKIETTQLQSLYGLNVVSASGEDILPIGMVTCKFKIQNTPFEHNFIVCKRIKRPMILGLDFLRKHKIGTTWSDKCTVPKYRAAVDYTLIGVEPHGPTRGVRPIAAVAKV